MKNIYHYVSEKWRHYLPKTLQVLQSRNWHDWRLDPYGAGVPPEEGLNGPVYTSTFYGIRSAQEAESLFAGDISGYAYPRISCGTPPVYQLSQALLDLELGKDHTERDCYECLLFASGMAAVSNLVYSLCDQGRKIIVSPYIYGGSYQFFNEICPRHGIEVIMVDNPLDLSDWWRKIDKNRDGLVALFAEDDSNPMMLKLNNEGLAELANENGLMYICDRTVGTPLLERPLTASLSERPHFIVHSASKNMNGYSSGLGGVVIGLSGDLETLKSLYIPTHGAILSPWAADRILWGLRTLEFRMKTKIENAKMVAQWLGNQSVVKEVRGPRADMVVFLLNATKEQTQRVFESTELIIPAPHLGDIRSLMIHCASTTHARVPVDLRQRIGIEDNMLRLSVGCEHHLDIIFDLKKQFEKVFG